MLLLLLLLVMSIETICGCLMATYDEDKMHGLQLERVRLAFSSFDIMSWKNRLKMSVSFPCTKSFEINLFVLLPHNWNKPMTRIKVTVLL